MALKIKLRPRERVIIGGAVVTCGGTGCELIIVNNAPILREKDIMNREDANTPSRRIYYVIQLMYVDQQNLITHHESYWKLVRDFVDAAPRTLIMINQVSGHILNGHYYKALKEARRLIDYEEEVVKRVRKPTGSI